MASIFQCDQFNSVLRVSTGCDGYNVIYVENFDDTNPGGRSMMFVPVTGYSLELSTNHQFLHSLDEFIYAFAFGDRIGELTVTGVAFTADACSTAGGDWSVMNEVGQANVYEYYLANKFSRTRRSTKIAIGGSSVQLIGFLTGVRMEVPNPALPIMQWALRFSVVVDTATSADGVASTSPAPPTGTAQTTIRTPNNNNNTGLVTLPGSGGGGGLTVSGPNGTVTTPTTPTTGTPVPTQTGGDGYIPLSTTPGSGGQGGVILTQIRAGTAT